MGNCCGTHTQAVNPLFYSITNTDTSKTISNPSCSLEQSGSSTIHISNHSRSNGPSSRPFSYSDMKAATRNFRNDGKLGEGGFGVVFRGHLDEKTLLPVKSGHGMTVAIKKLHPESLQGHQEWVTEVTFLGALHHPNIVRLIGFCAEDKKRLLVYEYMPRGSLDNHLFRHGSQTQALPWHIRMKIALGAARGLAFLHDARQHIIYRDFKAANILLDENYNAKLSDFGLAKDGPTGEDTHVSTRILGTYGYAAPEYLATGHLTKRSDVYSFGVALLELLTGRRAMDVDRPHAEQKVVDWARPYLGSKKQERHIMDPRLNGDYSLKVAHGVAYLALQCLNEDARARPTMKQAVEYLEHLINTSSK